jgi:hypothetical protein
MWERGWCSCRALGSGAGQAGGDDPINYHAHNGRWNGTRHRFDDPDFLWCHKDTPRQIEGTRHITADPAKADLKRTPDFAADGGGQTGASSHGGRTRTPS